VHRDSLAIKELCPELTKAMDGANKTTNYMKSRPLKTKVLHKYEKKKNGDTVSVAPLLLCLLFKVSAGWHCFRKKGI
jgi:hypothetical protein